MTKLHVGGEHVRAGADTPGHNGLGDPARLQEVAHSVLLDAAHFAEENEHFDVWVVLISEQVVDEGGARVAVAPDGDALVDPVGVDRADVVELVAHPAGPGDVGHVARSVEAAADDVVHHAARVADPETAGLDAANGGGPDDGDTLSVKKQQMNKSTNMQYIFSYYYSWIYFYQPTEL